MIRFEEVKSEAARQAGMKWMIVGDVRMLYWNGRVYVEGTVEQADEVQKQSRSGLKYTLLYKQGIKGDLLGLKVGGKTFIRPDLINEEETEDEEIEL